MLLLMTLRANHTITATMFLAKALEKLSLGRSTLTPVSVDVLLLKRRASCMEEEEFITKISSSLTKEVQRFNLVFSFWTLVLFNENNKDIHGMIASVL